MIREHPILKANFAGMPEDISYLYTKARNEGVSVRSLIAQRMGHTPLPLNEFEDRRWIEQHRVELEREQVESDWDINDRSWGAHDNSVSGASNASSPSPSRPDSPSVLSRFFLGRAAKQEVTIELDPSLKRRTYEEALAASKPRSFALTKVRGALSRASSRRHSLERLATSPATAKSPLAGVRDEMSIRPASDTGPRDRDESMSPYGSLGSMPSSPSPHRSRRGSVERLPPNAIPAERLKGATRRGLRYMTQGIKNFMDRDKVVRVEESGVVNLKEDPAYVLFQSTNTAA